MRPLLNVSLTDWTRGFSSRRPLVRLMAVMPKGRFLKSALGQKQTKAPALCDVNYGPSDAGRYTIGIAIRPDSDLQSESEVVRSASGWNYQT